MANRIIFLVSLALVAGTEALSCKADAPSMITYSSGTGFFVTRDGYILTNNHVINHCHQITVNGAVTLADARLVAQDAEFDLALLKTDALAGNEAHLNSNKQPLKKDDGVVVIGYPGAAWQTGQTQTREAHIISLTGPGSEEKWLQFSDSLALGNSGGPLLDSAGNVVGVVVAKGRTVQYNETAAREETVGQYDLAISLPVVRKFLSDHGVRFSEADSGIYLSSDRIADSANRFVVNVRCKIEP